MNSRAKGLRAENELAARLRELGFHAARRNSAMYEPGHDREDVEAIPGWHIECKRVERLNLSEAMKQARRDADAIGARPMVCHRRNREPWLMTITLEDIFTLADSLRR